MIPGVTLRVARPTDRLDEIARQYADGLGLEILGEFRDHDGFDGVMVGRPGHPHHLEFTSCAHHEAGRSPSPDHLLVFYLPVRDEWEGACTRMTAAGFRAVPSFNPYWDVNGRTFEDADGYRVVLQNAAWPAGAGVRPAAAGDLPAVRELLAAAGLPADGVAQHIATFRVADADGGTDADGGADAGGGAEAGRGPRIAGVAGLELCGNAALLRSVAVRPDHRGRGVARALCDELERDAVRWGVRDLFLLTETAEDYFRRRGFRPTDRAGVPERIAATEEFRSLCPDSAVAMHRALGAGNQGGDRA